MLWIAFAFAAPAYYLPDDVAASSKVFAETSAKMQPRFEAAQTRVAQVSKALNELDIGSSLLGTKAPEGMQEWAESTRRSLTGQSIRLQRFLARMQEDYSGVFLAALQRVLPGVSAGFAVVECGNTGVMAQFKKNNCEGTSLNEKLAAALDEDAGLKKELADIESLEWPVIAIEAKSWAVVPLTGGSRYMQFSTLSSHFFGDQLLERQAELEAALDPLTEALEDKNADAIAQALKLKAQWRSNLGVDGVAWMPVLTAALERAQSMDIGLCGSPALLGGCEGEDVTSKLVEQLKGDKKFLKATSKI